MNRFFILFLSLFFFVLSPHNVIADEDDNEVESVEIIDGQTVIFLDEDIQQSSGITTQTLKQVEYQPEFIAYGKAISINPLLTTLNQYSSANAKQAAAKSQFTQAEKNISRLRQLHKDDAVSTRKLQLQQAELNTNKAIYNEMTFQAEMILNNSRLQWGDKLSQWASNKQSAEFNQLISGNASLLKISFPVNNALPSNITSIVADSAGNRSTAVSASLIDVLPSVDNYSQGLQYLFLSNSPKIKTGMTVTAWIPQTKQKKFGIIIPESSLVWHLGQSFVFIKKDSEHFIHHNIDTPVKTADGFFIQDQIAEGDEIVVTGSQMLLSHEFRSQIPDEDDDD